MNVLKSLAFCDYYYSWGRFLVSTLKSAGCRYVRHLPFGYCPELHPYNIALTDVELLEYSCDLVFVGSYDKEREELIRSLLDFDVRVYGVKWADSIKADNPLFTRVCADVWGVEMSKRFKAAKIVLNHMRTFNLPSHNFRVMEAAGINGGVLVNPRTEELGDLYIEDEHLFCYSNISELRSKITTLLGQQEITSRVSNNGHLHTMKNHLLDFRVEQILRDFGYL